METAAAKYQRQRAEAQETGEQLHRQRPFAAPNRLTRGYLYHTYPDIYPGFKNTAKEWLLSDRSQVEIAHAGHGPSRSASREPLSRDASTFENIPIEAVDVGTSATKKRRSSSIEAQNRENALVEIADDTFARSMEMYSLERDLYGYSYSRIHPRVVLPLPVRSLANTPAKTIDDRLAQRMLEYWRLWSEENLSGHFEEKHLFGDDRNNVTIPEVASAAAYSAKTPDSPTAEGQEPSVQEVSAAAPQSPSGPSTSSTDKSPSAADLLDNAKANWMALCAALHHEVPERDQRKLQLISNMVGCLRTRPQQ